VVTSLTGRTDHFVMFPKRGMWIKERKARSWWRPFYGSKVES
jgi:hypothetical protein